VNIYLRCAICTYIAFAANPQRVAAVTVDRVYFHSAPINFNASTDVLQYFFWPTGFLLSDGTHHPRGEGLATASEPHLIDVHVDDHVTATFEQDPTRSFMAQFYSLRSDHAIYMEFRLIEMTIRGEVGSSVGSLQGIAQLQEFPDGYSSDQPATVPIGTYLSMSGTVSLLNGAVFSPTMWNTAKTMQIDGLVDTSRAIPEVSSLVSCCLAIGFISMSRRRRGFLSRIG
jgi:hypothetical protein